MTDYNGWKRKYREVFGCEVFRDPEGSLAIVCWCEVCVAMETAWEDAMRTALAGAVQGVDKKRHPAYQGKNVVRVSYGL